MTYFGTVSTFFGTEYPSDRLITLTLEYNPTAWAEYLFQSLLTWVLLGTRHRTEFLTSGSKLT